MNIQKHTEAKEKRTKTINKKNEEPQKYTYRD